MRIGLNLLYLLPGKVGGTETYAIGLLNGLQNVQSQHEFILFVNKESAGWSAARFPSFRTIICPVAGVHREQRYYYEQVRLAGLAREHHVDVLHSLGYTSPLFAHCPTVATVADLNFKAFGNTMSLERRLALAFFVKQAIRRCSHVITISNFSRTEITRHYHVSSDKITVAYLAAGLPEDGIADTESEGARSSVGAPYFVAFSSPSANKNIPNLIRAYMQLKEQHKMSHRLVLIGHRFEDRGPKSLRGRVSEKEGVIQTGYVNRTVLTQTVRGAEFLVFPSYYEGFGLPVLDAMAAGVPVICSNAASLPEVAGEAALYFNPASVNEMADRILQLCQSNDLRNELRKKGFDNLRRFSWKRTAELTMEVYERLGSKSVR